MLRSFESTFCAGCLVGGPRRGANAIGKRYRGVGGMIWRGQKTAGMQYVRSPMSVLSVASDGKEEEGGGRGGLAAVCGSYENCSVLKPGDCNTALPNIPLS